MPKLFIFFLFLAGCTIKPDLFFASLSKKSYPELLNEYKSCIGKGVIDSKGNINGKLYFSFKSQRDSTFIQFSDILGRKTILMWVSSNNITVRDLVNNTYYENSQIIDFFPFLIILNNKNINEIVWGVIPDYKPNLKKINKEMKSHIELKFERSRFINGQYDLSNLYYNDKNSGNALKINFKNRQRDNDYINIKKMWKMLDY